jgi:hypothetical protein
MFAFWIEPSKPASLSLLFFDHNVFARDEPIGTLSIDIATVARDETVEQDNCALESVKSGRVSVVLQRAALTSEVLMKKLIEMTKSLGPIKATTLLKHGVTIENLIGRTPFVTVSNGTVVNPALQALENALGAKKLKLHSQRSLAKVARILHSQRVTHSLDVPTRHVMLVHVSDWAPLKSVLQPTTGVGFGLNCVRYYGSDLAIATFNSVHTALLVILQLHTAKQADFRVLFAPCSSIARLIKHDEVVYVGAGVLNVAGPFAANDVQQIRDRSMQMQHLLFVLAFDQLDSSDVSALPTRRFIGYSRFKNEPMFDIKAPELVTRAQNAYSIELSGGSLADFSVIVKYSDPSEAQYWTNIFHGAEGQIDTPQQTPTCRECGNTVPVSDMYRTQMQPFDASMMCRSCLRCQIFSLAQSEQPDSFTSLNRQFSNPDLVELLSAQEYTDYLERSFRAYTSHNRNFVHCPECEATVEVEFHSWATKNLPDYQPAPDTVGLDRQKLKPDAVQHFLTNRFLCLPCNINFCRGCKETPYHLGLTCDEFKIFKHAPKCRFCGVAVLPGHNQHPNAAVTNCCSVAECVERMRQCCPKTNECGHDCNGCAGEVACPPCLHPDCESGALAHGIHQTSENECNICFAEELGQAPCVVLQCQHVFHAECLQTRLAKGWNGASIDFAFLKCPLCEARVSHSKFANLLASYELLEDRVSQKAMERLQFEGLDKDVAIMERGGRFYQNPRAFAMHHFSFYQCFDCKNPYFAGARACAAEVDAAEINRQDLVCAGCQKIASVESCELHGNDWLSFKCRFCCSNAVWHCWGLTHFCEPCHNNHYQYVEGCTGRNKLSYDQYNNCPGLAAKLLVIRNDNINYPTEELKKSAMEKCQSDPSSCPLKMRHPPHGVEFGMGCGLCRDEETKKQNEEIVSRATLNAPLLFDGNLQAANQSVEEAYRVVVDETGMLATFPSQNDPDWRMLRSRGPVFDRDVSIEYQLVDQGGFRSMLIGLQSEKAQFQHISSKGLTGLTCIGYTSDGLNVSTRHQYESFAAGDFVSIQFDCKSKIAQFFRNSVQQFDVILSEPMYLCVAVQHYQSSSNKSVQIKVSLTPTVYQRDLVHWALQHPNADQLPADLKLIQLDAAVAIEHGGGKHEAVDNGHQSLIGHAWFPLVESPEYSEAEPSFDPLVLHQRYQKQRQQQQVAAAVRPQVPAPVPPAPFQVNVDPIPDIPFRGSKLRNDASDDYVLFAKMRRSFEAPLEKLKLSFECFDQGWVRKLNGLALKLIAKSLIYT